MTLEEVKGFFGDTSYMFCKLTGMHHNAYRNWARLGYIPIKTQMRLERITGGKLKASLDDLRVADDD